MSTVNTNNEQPETQERTGCRVRRENMEKCLCFVRDECVLGPQRRVKASKFGARLCLSVLDKEVLYDLCPKFAFLKEMPDFEWWKREVGIDPRPRYDSDSDFMLTGIALLPRCPERGRMRALENRVAELEERLTEMYHAPGMPGYVASRESFERLVADDSV